MLYRVSIVLSALTKKRDAYHKSSYNYGFINNPYTLYILVNDKIGNEIVKMDLFIILFANKQ